VGIGLCDVLFRFVILARAYSGLGVFVDLLLFDQ
jgi:hypothetical protein